MKRNQQAALPILCLALGAVCVAVDPGSVGHGITRLLGVTVRPETRALAGPEDPDARTFVDISTSGPAAYHILRLENPAHLVLDLERARLPERPRTVRGRPLSLKDVLMGQFRGQSSPVARVVADPTGNPVFQVREEPNALEIELQSREGIAAPAVARIPMVVQASSPPSRQDAGATELATELPHEAAQAARALQTLAQDQTLSPGAVTVTPQNPAKPMPPSASGQYTGQPISVNLKDVDLKDFFRLIHEISGLNIIVDPNVNGTLTLVLDDVPWDQALDIVLKNNGLGRELEGNVLRIAKTETLAAEEEDQVKLAEAQEDSAPLVTVVRALKYARAVDTTPSLGGGGQIGTILPIPGVVTILQKMTTLFSKRGIVVADSRNNAVMIIDVPKHIPIIESVVDKLDRKAQQISIQARIVLTTNDFTRQFQSALNGGAFNCSNSVVGAGTTGTGSSVTPSTQFTNPPPTNRVSVVPTGASGFGAFAISNLGARYFIDAAISAAERRNEARTISAPTIVTQNNVPGEVLQGTQIPLQTIINNTVTTIYINATLTLDVLPQVTEDGNIFLNIRVQNNSPGPVLTGTQNPEINTQAATTQVMVPDGGTVIFGGIKVSSTTRSITQVPGLGDIPVLGHLFKSSNREIQANDLLFIVTPKVLPDKAS